MTSTERALVWRLGGRELGDQKPQADHQTNQYTAAPIIASYQLILHTTLRSETASRYQHAD